MIAWIVLVLAMQDVSEPFCATARVVAERMDAERDATVVSKGTLAVTEGDEGLILQVDLHEGRRRTRVTLRGETVVTEARGKTREESLAPGEGFHPFDLWRRGLRPELEQDFEIVVEKDALENPRKPKPLRGRPRSLRVAVKTQVETYRVTMIPRNPEWRHKFGVIRLGMVQGALPIRTITVETEAGTDNYRLEAVETPPAAMED